MIILNKAQIILMHKKLIEATGGSPELRDEGLLESALVAPFQTLTNRDFTFILSPMFRESAENRLRMFLLFYDV